MSIVHLSVEIFILCW